MGSLNKCFNPEGKEIALISNIFYLHLEEKTMEIFGDMILIILMVFP
jgi:hypothetical protein